MLSLKECEKILRENGFAMSEDLDLRELRDFLYHLAALQIENEEKCSKNDNKLRYTKGPTNNSE